jgi:hypothetical protein
MKPVSISTLPFNSHFNIIFTRYVSIRVPEYSSRPDMVPADVGFLCDKTVAIRDKTRQAMYV